MKFSFVWTVLTRLELQVLIVVEAASLQGDLALIVAGTRLPLWLARPNLF
jgi:hypothetical protein